MLEPKRWAIFMLLFLVACAFNVGRVKVTVCFECEIAAPRPS